MIDKLRYTGLLKKYLDGDIDSAGKAELFKMTASENVEEILAEMIDTDLNAGQLEGTDMPVRISDGILKKILASEKSTNQLFVSSNRNRLYQVLSVAAIFLVIVSGAVLVYYNTFHTPAQTAFEASIPKNTLTEINNTSRPVIIALEDGSTVKLTPHSSLSYPEHFTNDKREVYLTGEAFFNVSKNPGKPFLVYYNNIVTKVLGTSFTIKTNTNTKNVEVSVRTGRVQVFENKNMPSVGPSREEVKSVILKPNQKTMYNAMRRNFETTLADSIHPLQGLPNMDKYLKNAKQPELFNFQKATSLKGIFSQVESVYGIEIIVENENIYKCDFTGDLSKQELLEKLHIICLAIGATYEVNGTKILVSGKGCN